MNATRLAAVLVALALPAGAEAAIPRIPIPGPLDGPLPVYAGTPVSAQPLAGPFPATNPVLAPDGRSGSGLAAGNGAASPLPGPLGHGRRGTSSLQFGTCASLAFDPAGRLLALCNGPLGATLRLIDPAALTTLSILTLPPRTSPDRTDLAGGTHFAVLADGTLLVPAGDRTLWVVQVRAGALRKIGAYDLRGALAGGERPFAVTAGFDGRFWVTGTAGSVLALTRSGAVQVAARLGAAVTEDLAADIDGLTIATARELVRLRHDGSVAWRRTTPEPSGSPPVVLGGGLIAFTEGARVVAVRAGDGATVCSAAPFAPGRVTAHLVAAGTAVVASNAHGYDSPLVTEGGRTTTGGLARVEAGEGCRIAWRSREVSPSAQPVVSRATGLLYTLVKPAGFPDAWNLAAIDWRTGATRFAQLAGEGLGHNSEGGAVVLGPDGTAYAGTFGGVVAFR